MLPVVQRPFSKQSVSASTDSMCESHLPQSRRQCLAEGNTPRTHLSSHGRKHSNGNALKASLVTMARLRGARLAALSLPYGLGDASSAVSIATTSAVADLLQRSGAFAADHVSHSAPGVAHLLHTLHHALSGTTSLLPGYDLLQDVPPADLHAHLDAAANSFGVGDAVTALQPSDAAMAAAHAATAPAGSILLQPILADVGTSGALDGAIAALSAHHAMHRDLAGLAAWAADKLAAVQTVDGAAYESLRGSLGAVLGVLSTALDTDTGQQAQQWTNALVLGVQQLITALRLDEDGNSTGGSIPTMLAAQEATQAALATTTSAPTGTTFGLPSLTQCVMFLVTMIVACIPQGLQRGSTDTNSNTVDDPVPRRYDPEELNQYFSRRPLQALQRNAEVVSRFSGLLVGLLLDWQTGRWESNMANRAIEARRIMEELGPAYVKIAQVISTRVDVVPETYLIEFRKLQDNVPTFSTVEARIVLEDGLTEPVDKVFEWLSEEPLAAASLGQVYRGKLTPEHGDAEVAVKVQRPGVLESVALDVFIMRRAAVLFSYLPGMSDQWAQVLDDWALRFFLEMDYQLEAHNTITFKKNMSAMQGIRVATVYPELTSRKIIVTEWVEGERLNETSTADVRALCSTLLNCYLIQLLETGLLHADPHPGNLLRAPDGKIVILDFGLVTEVSEEQRIALVEYIAHLSVEDWDSISRDLISLGFVPPGLSDEAHAVIAPVMKQVMGVILRGGGLSGATAGVNMPALMMQLESCASNYKLVIPPYFALILRAFSVIEGIALRVDPDYTIFKECMPYLSRRLLTDNNPRMRAALKQLLYGDKKRLDVDRLQKMISSFTNFTTAAMPTSLGPTFTAVYDERGAPVVRPSGAQGGALAGTSTSVTLAGVARRASVDDSGPVVNEAMKEALKVVFAKNGSYAQELIVDELVAATDAMSREALSEGLRMVFSSAATVATLRSADSLGPLRTMLMPLPLPTEMLKTHEPTLCLTLEDRQALGTIRALLGMVQHGVAGVPEAGRAGSRALRVAGELMPMMPELLPGVQVTLELFIRQLVRRMAMRLAEDLEPGKLIGLKKACAS